MTDPQKVGWKIMMQKRENKKETYGEEGIIFY